MVTAARQALEANSVNLILPYVQTPAEAELTAAFARTMRVRQLGGEASELADRWFFETAVRLHRAGEGASYTGLTEQRDFGPAIAAAELALTSGSLDAVHEVLLDAIHRGLVERYEHVLAARAHAVQQGTVTAHRERVEAELTFEQYVDELYHLTRGVAFPYEHTTAQTIAADRCPRASSFAIAAHRSI